MSCRKPARTTVFASFSKIAETAPETSGSDQPAALAPAGEACTVSCGRTDSRSESRCARTALAAPVVKSSNRGVKTCSGRPSESACASAAAQPGGVSAMIFQWCPAKSAATPGRCGFARESWKAAKPPKAVTTESPRRKNGLESNAPATAPARCITPATAQMEPASAKSSAQVFGAPGSRPTSTAMAKSGGQKKSQTGSSSCAAKFIALIRRGGTA